MVYIDYFIKEMKVYYITCYVEYDNIIKINYSIHDLQWKNDTDCVAEKNCFATKKSAQLWYGISDDNLFVEQSQKECKKRNG